MSTLGVAPGNREHQDCVGLQDPYKLYLGWTWGPSMALPSHLPQWKESIRQQVSDWKPWETRGICMTNWIFICFVGQVNIKETTSLRIHITWPCRNLHETRNHRLDTIHFLVLRHSIPVACRIMSHLHPLVDGSELWMTLTKQHASKWQLPSTVGKTSCYLSLNSSQSRISWWFSVGNLQSDDAFAFIFCSLTCRWWFEDGHDVHSFLFGIIILFETLDLWNNDCIPVDWWLDLSSPAVKRCKRAMVCCQWSIPSRPLWYL